NGDGSSDTLIDAVDASASLWLLKLFRSAANRDVVPSTVDSRSSLRELLRANALDLKARPWGTTGLCFYGLPGQSVAGIDRQEEARQPPVRGAFLADAVSGLWLAGADRRHPQCPVFLVVRIPVASCLVEGASLPRASRDCGDLGIYRYRRAGWPDRGRICF